MANISSDELLKIRHSAEHILTEAMHAIWGKDQVVMAMGPATQDGFYFDFEPVGDLTISDKDFSRIEKEMRKIINRNLPIRREEISIDKARELFKDNPYKQEWLDEIEKRGEQATVYWTGDEFVDLCAGPHVDSTGAVKAIKLLSVAGAYWHGDEKNKMLTRIYGTAFDTEDALKDFLWKLEEAKKRDHKKLGRELDLFTFSDLVGAGLPLWTPRGTLVRDILNEYVWQLRKARGYERVEIPHITKKDLYEKSGHWAKFKEELFKIKTREDHEFAMKPMNCPHHTQIFARKIHSYKEMPQRYANTTMVYRDEQTGELSGLSRVRCITQDDAHVFCRHDQISTEMLKIWDIIDEFYKAVGFTLRVRLSLHDPAAPEKYLGKPEDWQTSEQALRDLAAKRGVTAVEAIGEAAFYGPKIDFMTEDSLGREWQVATIQLDFNMPRNFELKYTTEKGDLGEVVMLHAAIMGSIERYMSILIEHFAGAFPVWLSPVQAVVIPITEEQTVYAKLVHEKLSAAGLRSELWDQAESMQKRIRKAEKLKTPYMLIIGQKEAESDSVAVRVRGQEDRGLKKVDEVLTEIADKAREKLLTL